MVNMIFSKHSIHLLFLVISLLFSESVYGQLKVYGPATLERKFVNGVIKTSFANFGFIPYGHSLVSTILDIFKNTFFTNISSLHIVW